MNNESRSKAFHSAAIQNKTKMKNQTTNTAITPEEAQQLSEAYARFHFLRNATIKQPKDDAELRGLTEYLASFFINHASEFIGCWHAIRSEYEPLLGLFARITDRVVGIRAQAAARMAQPEGPAIGS